MMEIHVRYFGLIAEKTGLSEEMVKFDQTVTIAEFNDFIVDKYQLSETPFRIAVNQNIGDLSTSLNNADEVAFLPPFAGG